MITPIKKLLIKNQSIIKFGIVGGLTAVLYFSLFALFWRILELHYQIAISLAYFISVTFYFLANRKFTFQSTGNTSRQLPRYGLLLLINYFVTLIVMHITVELFSFLPYFGIVASVGITFIINYQVSKRWIFKNA